MSTSEHVRVRRVRVRDRLSGVPLSTRLVAALLALLCGGLLVSGLVGVSALRGYLLDRVDTQLVAAAQDGEGVVDDGPRQGRGGHERLNTYYLAYGTGDGSVVAAATTSDSPPVLPALTTQLAQSSGGRPFTVSSADGDGSWRVVVDELRDGGGVAAVAVSTDDVERTVRRLLVIDAVTGLGVLVLLGGAALLLVRSSLRPLRGVERTAAAIAAGDLSRRVEPAPTSTEVGRLSQALNAMLSRIEEAFQAQRASEEAARLSEAAAHASGEASRASEERMRRFVADASHELRTPLTSIRGFAELYRSGAVGDADGVARVMGRMESEAVRMGRLVDELLLLARLDQARPLESAPVDVLALAGDAVHDAGVWAGERSLELVAVCDTLPVVLGDDGRLRQVLVNLLRNAVVHTPVGTRVTVTVATCGERVELVVADDGPGLTAEQAEHVFERFYRADAARTRTSGGSGLGLSIVASLVQASGGDVRVESAPGQGARFVVTLPLAAVPAPALEQQVLVPA